MPDLYISFLLHAPISLWGNHWGHWPGEIITQNLRSITNQSDPKVTWWVISTSRPNTLTSTQTHAWALNIHSHKLSVKSTKGSLRPSTSAELRVLLPLAIEVANDQVRKKRKRPLQTHRPTHTQTHMCGSQNPLLSQCDLHRNKKKNESNRSHMAHRSYVGSSREDGLDYAGCYYYRIVYYHHHQHLRAWQGFALAITPIWPFGSPWSPTNSNCMPNDARCCRPSPLRNGEMIDREPSFASLPFTSAFTSMGIWCRGGLPQLEAVAKNGLPYGMTITLGKVVTLHGSLSSIRRASNWRFFFRPLLLGRWPMMNRKWSWTSHSTVPANVGRLS